jgi:hypothetical protein
MPAQHFSLNEATAPLATVVWDVAYATVELTYAGTLLTRINDADSLRTTGLQGQTLDGSTLVLRLVPDAVGETFQLERNGVPMYPSEVDAQAAGPAAALTYGASERGPTPAQEAAMRSGRRWIRGFGILLMVGGAAAVLLAAGDKTVIGSVETVKFGSDYVRASSLRTLGIGVAVFGLLFVFIAKFARGHRAALMFGIGATLCLLLAAANLFSGSPIGALIPACAGGSAVRSWKFARDAAKGDAV